MKLYDQAPHHFEVALKSSDKQGRDSLTARLVDVSTELLEKALRYSHPAHLTCDVQWRRAF
jgi:hypothetical protein